MLSGDARVTHYSELTMNIHEYQAKQLLDGYGVAVPRGKPAFTADEAAKAAEELGGDLWDGEASRSLSALFLYDF